MIAPTGSFISYATAPGNVAADGAGDNGLFTERLLQHMTTPGLKLEEVFKRVRANVQQDSSNKQVPWDSSSVTGDFFFVPAEGVVAAKPKVVDPAKSSDEDFTAQAWEVIKDSKDPELLEEFIKLFPEAPQHNLARLKLMAMASSSSTEALAQDKNVEITDEEFCKKFEEEYGISLPESEYISSKEQVLTASSVNSEVLSGEAAKEKLLATNTCEGCDLSEAILYKASLSKAILSEANLRGADLSGAYLFKAKLEEAKLSDAYLYGANLRKANLRGADLSGAYLYDADLTEATFCYTKMPDGSINNQDCSSFSSEEAPAKTASTSSKEPVSVVSSVISEVLSGKAAIKKLLTIKKCSGCFLEDADLSDAYLYGANLRKANLRGADLRRAYLHDANMEGANLGYFPSLRGARFCNTTMLDGAINNQDC